MVNRKTIQEIDEALDRWHAKLNMAVRKINDLRDERKKIILGKIKRVPQPGVKVKIASNNPGITHEDLNDPLPSFGP